MKPVHDSLAAATVTRREAIRRAAVILGAAISPSLLAALAEGGPVAGALAGGPRHLGAEEYATAAAIAERILPRTDTPGARDAGVPEFIDLLYGRYLSQAERTSLQQGLAAIEAAGVKAGSRGFAQLPADRQDELLRQFAASTVPHEKGFFRQMRELTLLGYFTSEPVGKNVLHFDPIPGRYDGCVPLAEVGNVAWTVK